MSSSSSTHQSNPDPHLDAAMSKHFGVGTNGNKKIQRLGTVRTELSEWELFVGEQMCPVSRKCVRTLVINKVEVFEKRKGIFTQGVRLLMNKMAVAACAPLLELQAVRNTQLYLWALRQPNVYVSPYHPESVYLILDWDAARTDVPQELRQQADDLRQLAIQEPGASQNMANRVITAELLREAMHKRSQEPIDPAYSAEEREQSASYLSSSLLHAACAVWLQDFYTKQQQSAQAAPQ